MTHPTPQPEAEPYKEAMVEAMMRVAQAWCDPRTSNRIMDAELAEVLAEMFVADTAALRDERDRLADELDTMELICNDQDALIAKHLKHATAAEAERDRLAEQKNELYETYMAAVFSLKERVAAAEAEIERLQDELDTQRAKVLSRDALIDDYKQRAEAAEAIVAKLPVTADDVPVVPGMGLHRAGSAVTAMRFVTTWEGDSVFVEVYQSCHGPNDKPLDLSTYYSTHDVALAAEGQGGDK